MATTVIEALIVTLGLDPSQFRRGQREAEQGMRHTEEQARRTAKEMEARGRQAAEFFNKIKQQVVALTGAYLTFAGIKAWTERLTKQDEALGRNAQAVGMSVTALGQWQAAAERSGVSADEMTGLFGKLQQSVEELQKTGTTGLMPLFQRLNININDFMKATQPERIFMLARALKSLPLAEAQMWGQTLGLGGANLLTMLHGGDNALRQLLEQMAKLHHETEADTDAAIARTNAWKDFLDSLNDNFRPILTAITPLMQDILRDMTGWVEQNRAWVQTNIVGAIKDFRDYIKQIDWDAVKEGAQQVWDKVNAVVEQLGGWKTVTEAIFGLWVASQIMPMISGLGLLVAALAGPEILAALAVWIAYYTAMKAAEGAEGAPSKPAAPKIGPDGKEEWPDTTLERLRKRLFGRSTAAAAPPTAGTMGPLADLIARGEAGKADYNAVNRGALGGYGAGMENLVNMTVADVMQAQKEHRFAAAGRYQIMPDNLRSAVGTLGLTGQEKFDKGMQDRIFTDYLLGIKRHEIADYIMGRSNDRNAALLGGAKEWAAIADPRTGKSYYAGVGNNRSTISAEEFGRRLDDARQMAARSPQGAQTVASNTSHEVHINGPITVNDAKDADNTAKGLRQALHNNFSYAMQANYGLS